MVLIELGTTRVDSTYVEAVENAQMLKNLQHRFEIEKDLRTKNVIGSTILRKLYPELHDDTNTFSMASLHPDSIENIVLGYD